MTRFHMQGNPGWFSAAYPMSVRGTQEPGLPRTLQEHVCIHLGRTIPTTLWRNPSSNSKNNPVDLLPSLGRFNLTSSLLHRSNGHFNRKRSLMIGWFWPEAATPERPLLADCRHPRASIFEQPMSCSRSKVIAGLLLACYSAHWRLVSSLAIPPNQTRDWRIAT